MQYSSCGRGRRSRDLCRTFLEFPHDRCAVLRRRLRDDLAGAGNGLRTRLADGRRISQLHCRVGIHTRPAGHQYGYLHRRFTGRLLGRAVRHAGGGAAVLYHYPARCIGAAEPDEVCGNQRSSWRRSSLCGGDDPGNCSQHGAFYAGRVCIGQGRHCTGSPFHCGVPAAVGAACLLPPEKGQSTIAHWDDPALCRTGDPVLGNIRISIVRCLRGILLLMAAPEKCAGRSPINLSGAFCCKKTGHRKSSVPGLIVP